MSERSDGSGAGLRYVVALLEIQGGLVGLWGVSRDLAATGFALPLAVAPGVAFIALAFAASIVAGVALWGDRPLGYALSLPVQAAQVVWFAGAHLTLRVSASGWLVADLFVRRAGDGATVVGWQFDAARKAGYALSLAPRADTTLAVNLVAAATLVWLASRRHRWRGGSPRG